MKQLSLIPSAPDTWETSDDWETPNDLARRIAGMVKPRDRFIIEPSAGTGQIAQYLPPGAWCFESNSCRCSIGAENYGQHQWHMCDFLEVTNDDLPGIGYADLIIGNPPFSLWTEFLAHALGLIHGGGRVIFLGPCDQFHKPNELKKLAKWKDRIQAIPHPIVGRVAYLKDGIQVSGRQVYDSIFEVTI